MRRLVLTPDRCAPIGSFNPGAYAYVFADRPIRLRGALVTPSPLQAYADENGEIGFDLIPASQVDDAQEFSYTVSAFDVDGSRMWSMNIVMPDASSLIWDLVPEQVDLDAQIHVPRECGPSESSGIEGEQS